MLEKVLLGCVEQIDLPDLNIAKMDIRVDTGAATSSVHVDDIEEYQKNGEAWIRFKIHPSIHDVAKVINRSAKVHARRSVKSSSGEAETRYVIKTKMVLAGQCWTSEITLTNRASMSYLMLLGREAMAGRFIVDPEREFVHGDEEEYNDIHINEENA